jgi:hypothetical protein
MKWPYIWICIQCDINAIKYITVYLMWSSFLLFSCTFLAYVLDRVHRYVTPWVSWIIATLCGHMWSPWSWGLGVSGSRGLCLSPLEALAQGRRGPWWPADAIQAIAICVHTTFFSWCNIKHTKILLRVRMSTWYIVIHHFIMTHHNNS